MAADRNDLRLAILQILAKETGYTAQQGTIKSRLKERGIIATGDQLQVEFCWLDKTANAVLDRVNEGVHILTLTGDGLEVVEGALEIGVEFLDLFGFHRILRCSFRREVALLAGAEAAVNPPSFLVRSKKTGGARLPAGCISGFNRPR